MEKKQYKWTDLTKMSHTKLKDPLTMTMPNKLKFKNNNQKSSVGIPFYIKVLINVAKIEIKVPVQTQSV